MNNATKEIIEQGRHVMYRKVDGVPSRLIVSESCGDVLIKHHSVRHEGSQETTIRLIGSMSDDLQEDIRHALDNCYCDAVTHCDKCSGHGFGNLHRHLNNRSDDVAKSRRSRFAVVDGGIA